jgi:FKBP-type peptidyl-prolyl cis-trans isomerase FkpA
LRLNNTLKLFHLIFFAAIPALIFVSGCKSGDDRQQQESFDPAKYKEPLIEANKHVVATEDQHIADFLSRYGWEMRETGTGLRYMIVEQGSGQKAQPGMVAVLDYRVRLITGDVIYSSDQKGYKEFLIGKGGVEAGLEQAVLLMRKGDSGRFILPSHLAYGLLGDQDQIPPKATLIYEMKLIDLK